MTPREKLLDALDPFTPCAETAIKDAEKSGVRACGTCATCANLVDERCCRIHCDVFGQSEIVTGHDACSRWEEK